MEVAVGQLHLKALIIVVTPISSSFHPSKDPSIHPSSDQVGRLPLLPWWLAEVQEDSSCSPSLCVPSLEKGRRSSSDTGGTGTSGGAGERRLCSLLIFSVCVNRAMGDGENVRIDNYLPLCFHSSTLDINTITLIFSNWLLVQGYLSSLSFVAVIISPTSKILPFIFSLIY